MLLIGLIILNSCASHPIRENTGGQKIYIEQTAPYVEHNQINSILEDEPKRSYSTKTIAYSKTNKLEANNYGNQGTIYDRYPIKKNSFYYPQLKNQVSEKYHNRYNSYHKAQRYNNNSSTRQNIGVSRIILNGISQGIGEGVINYGLSRIDPYYNPYYYNNLNRPFLNWRRNPPIEYHMNGNMIRYNRALLNQYLFSR